MTAPYDGFARAVLQWFFWLLLSTPFGLVFYYVVDRFLRVRKRWYCRLGVVTAGLCAACMVIFIGDAFNILFFLPFFAAALWFGTEGSRSARFSMALLLYPMLMAFNAVMDNGLMRFPGSEIQYILFQNTCRLLFWGMLALFSRRFVPESAGTRRPMLPPRLWLLLDLLALTPAASVFVLVVYPSFRSLPDQTVWQFRAAAMYILPVVVVSSSGLLYAVTVLSRHEALRRKESMWAMQELYYQNLEQEQTQVRRLRHDMANHLQALSGLLDEPEKARGYLESLTHMPGLTVSRRFCDNPVVNTVLAGKSAIMEEKGISADIAVVLPRELPLSEPDLCALFANAVDNAVEACGRLADPAERMVRIRARADKGLLMMQVTNRTDRSAPATLETTKEDKARHGYGLGILREIAERAGGTCGIEQRPGVFELIVTIPIP